MIGLHLQCQLMMSLLLIAAVPLPFAAAQNTTFDPNSVDQITKNQWCQSEIDNCLLLCGGDGSTQDNACESGALQYTCTCSNNSSPANIAQYQGTIPNYICQRAYSECTTGVDGLSSSERCQPCGTLQPSDVPNSASPPSTSSSSAKASLDGASTNHTSTVPTTETIPSTPPTASPAAAKPSVATSGLSSSAKIGVGVGVSLGAVTLAIVLAGLVLWRRRKQQSRLDSAGNADGVGRSATISEPKMQELDGDNGGGGSAVRELDTIESPPYSRELAGSPGPQRYELE